MSVLIQVAQLILSLTILVFLHEGGHFTFAKLFKTRVSRFYVFANWKFHLWSSYDNWWRRLIGKPLLEERDNEADEKGNKPLHFAQQVKNFYFTVTGQKHRVNLNAGGNKVYNDEAGTEYGIGWLPIGGYCQIDGMVDETQSAEDLAKKPVQPWEFRSKKAYQRLLIMAGGVMVNFFLALIIYSAVFYSWGEDYFAVQDMEMGMKFNDEAKSYGFKDHDILLRSDRGEFRDFSANLVRDISKAHEVTVLRNGKEVSVKLSGELNLLNMIKDEPVFCRPLVPAEIDSILPGMAAEKAGLKKGDKIIALGDQAIDSWNTFTYEISRYRDALIDAKTKADTASVLTTSIVWQKAGTQVLDTAKVTMQVTNDNPALGVVMTTIRNYYKPRHIEYGLIGSIKAGSSYGITMLSGYVSDLKYVASKEGAKSLGGFGAIGSMFPPVWDWYAFWMMTAFLSIILAFMNIIPIPGLDGGHILFLLVEVVTRKQPSMKFMQVAQNIGMGLLLILMVVANLNDVLRWLGIM